MTTTPMRVKFQVWSPAQQRWRTAYCKLALAQTNVDLMRQCGFVARIVWEI
jgi:hypothetical protein